MSNRKLDALRALAERPGTDAEGKLAREILERLEAKRDARHADKPEDERPRWVAFEDYLHGDLTTDEFLEAMRRRVKWEREQPLPTEWVCACRSRVPIGAKCESTFAHLAIQQTIREKFKPGERVYYNKWAYDANCPGFVKAYVRLKEPNGDHPWAWISVKFDHLKNARQIPIYSAKGWHLSHAPVDRETLRATGLREGMEKCEGINERIEAVRG